MKIRGSQSGSAITEFVIAIVFVAFSATAGLDLFSSSYANRFEEIGIALGGGTSTTTTEGEEVPARPPTHASIVLP